jgi:hypothetical protein
MWLQTSAMEETSNCGLSDVAPSVSNAKETSGSPKLMTMWKQHHETINEGRHGFGQAVHKLILRFDKCQYPRGLCRKTVYVWNKVGVRSRVSSVV